MTLTIYTLFNEFPLVFLSRVAISLLILFCLIFASYRLYKCRKFDKYQFTSSIILSLYLVLMLYLTVLGRYSHDEYRSQIMIFGSYQNLFTNFDFMNFAMIILNIAMFIPVGFVLPIVLKNCRHKYMLSMLIALLLTSAIEVAQYFSRTGTFETDDIFNNMLGAVIGLLLLSFIKRIHTIHKKNIGQISINVVK